MDRNNKGQFIKGHSLGKRFTLGHKMNLGKSRPDMIGNTLSVGNHPKSEFKKGCISHNKGKPNTWTKRTGEDTYKNIRRRYMSTLEYIEWRKSVFARDNYTCVNCGAVGGDLIAHHLYYFREFPEIRTSINNGMTMCVNCHTNVHNMNRNLDGVFSDLYSRPYIHNDIVSNYVDVLGAL